VSPAPQRERPSTGAEAVMLVRWRSVWALGVCHGLLGVFFYYWVLGRDPWLEILGTA